MAFETSDKSGLNNGRTTRLDISNINQSKLAGERASTDEQLLQLIIDNLAGVKIPENTKDVNNDGKIDVNDLIFNVSEAFKRYAKTQTDKVTLPNLMDALTNGVAVLHSDLAVQKKVADGLQKSLDKANKGEKGEKNPVIYSSGTLEQNKLHPIEAVVRATEKEVVTTNKLVGTTGQIAKSLQAQIPDMVQPLTEYKGVIEYDTKTLADTVKNMWTVIGDLRDTVRILLDETSDRLTVARMGGIYAFYLHGTNCNTLLLNASSTDGAAHGARDIWNENGVPFDPAIPAFTNAVPSVSSECLNGTWYALTGTKGNNTIGKYSKIAPFWSDVSSMCPAPKKTYTDASVLEV
jgi:hypothetical protein